jgi:hypothetical protein
VSTRLAGLLQAWRDAERRRDALPPDHPDRAVAELAVEEAHAAYLAADEAQASGIPPAWTDPAGTLEAIGGR